MNFDVNNGFQENSNVKVILKATKRRLQSYNQFNKELDAKQR